MDPAWYNPIFELRFYSSRETAMKQSISNTRDGFRILKDRFALPKNISGLDLKSMHTNSICDLFLNENLHLRDIVRLVRDDRGTVIHTLLEQGVIEERRKKRREILACPN
jgi:hypothetical protein